MKRSDADLVRLHAGLRKEAAFGPELMNQLRLHAPALTGAAIGGVIAPKGKETESIVSGALGGIIGNAVPDPLGGTKGYTGALVGPVAYSLYHHLTKDDQPQGVPHGYVG